MIDGKEFGELFNKYQKIIENKRAREKRYYNKRLCKNIENLTEEQQKKKDEIIQKRREYQKKKYQEKKERMKKEKEEKEKETPIN